MTALGYTPNVLAHALARSTTNTGGLAMSASRNPSFGDMVDAIEAGCAACGVMVLLADTRDDPGGNPEPSSNSTVDGILMAPSAGPETSALTYRKDSAVPAVLVDRLPDAWFDGVGIENAVSTSGATALSRT